MVKIRDIVAAFCSTVSDLGLYGCRFPSYTEMISLVRAFPHCDSLYIRDCVISGESATGNIFSELQEHKLSLNVLEPTCASPNGSTIGVSTLIEDACLDVSRLLPLHVIQDLRSKHAPLQSLSQRRQSNICNSRVQSRAVSRYVLELDAQLPYTSR